MKVHILFTFKNGSYGGVNQFLKALKEYMVEKDYYTNNIKEADLVLFNSGHNVDEVIKYKKCYPQKVFVQRIDGPSRLYNKMSDKRDLIANTLNFTLADATVFQSNYSKDANYKMGLRKNFYETTIMNAPNGKIFYPNKERKEFTDRKCKLIATSWSDNYNKGFEYYQYLDENLDFNRYEMTFVGNSPIEFKNVKHLQPLNSEELAEELRRNDIYITGSKKDPCSNALIEALFCGLPAVALKDGGHPEIVGDAGELFESKEDLLVGIEKVWQGYDNYVEKISLADMEEIGNRYIQFFKDILSKMKEDRYKPKKCNVICIIRIKSVLLIQKISDKIERLISKK